MVPMKPKPLSDFAKQKISDLKSYLETPVISKNISSSYKYKPVSRKTLDILPTHKKAHLKLKGVVSYSHKDDALGDIFSVVRRVKWLNGKLSHHLGLPLSAHIRLVNITETEAVIFATSSAWAQRAKFAQDDIVLFLNKYCGGTLQKIKSQVDKY